MNRNTVLLAIAAFVAGILLARVVPVAGPAPGVYQIQAMSSGWVWRVNTVTGEIAICHTEYLTNPVACKDREDPRTPQGHVEMLPEPKLQGKEKAK